MSDEGLIQVLKVVEECPVCARYAVRLAAAVRDPLRNGAPSTEAQVRHERMVHGSQQAYYRKLRG